MGASVDHLCQARFLTWIWRWFYPGVVLFAGVTMSFVSIFISDFGAWGHLLAFVLPVVLTGWFAWRWSRSLRPTTQPAVIEVSDARIAVFRRGTLEVEVLRSQVLDVNMFLGPQGVDSIDVLDPHHLSTSLRPDWQYSNYFRVARVLKRHGYPFKAKGFLLGKLVNQTWSRRGGRRAEDQAHVRNQPEDKLPNLPTF